MPVCRVGGGSSYLTPPVVLWDGDVVTAHTAGLGQAVVLRRQVREVAVQIQVLCVLPPACPPIVAGALKTQATPVQGSAHRTLTPSTRDATGLGWAESEARAAVSLRL